MAAAAAYNNMDVDCRVLGLDLYPSEGEIRAAYKTLALRWHPDRQKANKEYAKDKFVEIHTAYQSLLRMAPTYVPRPPPSTASSSGSSQGSTFYSDGSASSQTSFEPSSPRSNPSSEDLSEPPPKAKHHKSKKRHHSSGDHHSDSSNHSESRHSDKSEHRSEKRSRHSEKSDHRSEQGDHHSEKDDHRSEGSSHHSHSSGSRRKKSSRRHHEDDEHRHRHRHHHRHKHDDRERDDSDVANEQEETPVAEQKPPTIGIPLRPSRLPASQNSDWVFPLPLTLEELYSGTSYRFQITRQLEPTSSSESLENSSTSSSSTIHIDLEVPAGGYKNGTQIRYEGIGNQRKSDGSFQDIVFIVQEIIHERFARISNDLVARIELLWDEKTVKDDVIFVEGLDGENIAVPVPAGPESSEETRLPKAGMPIRNSEGRTVGRGDLVIRWEFVFPETTTSSSESPRSKWQTFKESVFNWQHTPVV